MQEDVKQETVASAESVKLEKRVNKVAYLALAFFLGGLGVHKFYAGKTVKGVLYLVFCWTFIPAIIALVEFFIALFKTSDEHGAIAV